MARTRRQQRSAPTPVVARPRGVLPPSALRVEVHTRIGKFADPLHRDTVMLGIVDRWGGCEASLEPHGWLRVLVDAWARYGALGSDAPVELPRSEGT